MSDLQWYVGVSGQQQGPMTEAQLLELISSKQIDSTAYVYSAQTGNWQPISAISAFANALSAAAGATPPGPPPPPPPGPAPALVPGTPAGAPPNVAPAIPAAQVVADEIDYEVFGEEMQFVEVTLDPREAAVSEAGAFMYMDPDIEMETIFGDGAQPDGGGFWGKLKSAGKRLLVGESLFMTVFSNHGQQRRSVAFAAPYAGKIIPVDLREHGGVLICQKDAFLAAAKGISVGIHFQKKLGAGLFGGEGFILQKLEGQGLAFIHAGGTIVERELAAGETLRVDTGCIVAFQSQVNYDIQYVGKIKTAFFGGEGLFFATLGGPGKVWLQSLPLSRLANRIYAAAARGGGAQVGEGSVLGGFGTGDSA